VADLDPVGRDEFVAGEADDTGDRHPSEVLNRGGMGQPVIGLPSDDNHG